MRTLMSAWMRSIRCHTIADLPEVGVSVPLQNGICFLRHLIPTASTVFLAVHLPEGKAGGLPRSAYVT
jgi:hypothetical protein